MYNYEQVMTGVMKYIDRELLPNINGISKWLFGTAAGIMGTKGKSLFDQFKNNSLLKSLEIIDGNNINVHTIYEEMLKQADKGPISIELPLIGMVKLDKTDVEKLYQYIIGG